MKRARLNRVATACGSRFLTEGLAIRSEHLGLTPPGLVAAARADNRVGPRDPVLLR